jgi:transposase-like protein
MLSAEELKAKAPPMHPVTPAGSKSIRYTPEFRAYAVAAVREGRSKETAAADLGIDNWTISRWMRAERDAARPPEAKEELRKVELFKEPRARKWSARLRFADGSKTTMQTEYAEEARAKMAAVVAWTNLSRAKGLIGPKKMPRRTPAPVDVDEPETKLFGRDKPRGHALAARPHHPRTRAAAADIQKANRLSALVDVLSVLERLDPTDAVWVMRAAAGVTDVNLREQQLVAPGRNGHSSGDALGAAATRELDRMGGD